MKRFVVAGDGYPVVVHTCEDEKEQKELYLARKFGNVWQHVIMVIGDYTLPDFHKWEYIKEKDIIKENIA